MIDARIAALIVSWNRKEDLDLCLKSMKESLPLAEKIDICVVDNASTDGTADFLAINHSYVKVLTPSTNLGFAGGNNFGMNYLLEQGYEYILLLNSDIIVDDDFLTPLVDCLDQHNEIGMVQPVILQYKYPQLINTDGNPIHFLGFGFSGNCDKPIHSVEKQYGDHHLIKIPAVSGAVVLIRSSLLKTIGIFDDLFFIYNEDLDLSWRARLAGWELGLCPQARIYHNYEYRPTSSQKIYLVDRNRLCTLLKNYRLGTLIVLLPVLVLFELFMVLYSVCKKWLPLKIRGYYEMATQKPSLLEKRRRVQKLRKISDRQLVKWFTAELSFEQVNGLLVKFGNFFLRYFWGLIRCVIFW